MKRPFTACLMNNVKLNATLLWPMILNEGFLMQQTICTLEDRPRCFLFFLCKKQTQLWLGVQCKDMSLGLCISVLYWSEGCATVTDNGRNIQIQTLKIAISWCKNTSNRSQSSAFKHLNYNILYYYWKALKYYKLN